METKQIATYFIIAGAVLLSMKFIKENKDDAKDEPFRGIDQ